MTDTRAAEPDDDIDLTLRHLTQRFPDELARALLPEAKTLTEVSWEETQVTARQRRMDRGLRVVADGRARIEHVEWQLRWERALPYRVYEYQCLLTMGLREATPEGKRPPRVRSTVVLLSGREAPWPAWGAYRTSPRDERFSGARFRIEPVYQYTLDALRARRSALWMVFAPLAADATPEAMSGVVAALRAALPARRFEEIAVAMTVLADADARERGLRPVIAAQLPEELVMQSWVYTQGREKGLEEGIERGIEKGIEKGLRQSIALALSARGLKLSAAHRARLDAEARAEVLQAWLTRAVTVARVADVFAD